MMKRILHKVKLVLIGALIAALERITQELAEYLQEEQGIRPEAANGEQGGIGHVCSDGVQ